MTSNVNFAAADYAGIARPVGQDGLGFLDDLVTQDDLDFVAWRWDRLTDPQPAPFTGTPARPIVPANLSELLAIASHDESVTQDDLEFVIWRCDCYDGPQPAPFAPPAHVRQRVADNSVHALRAA